MGAGAGGAGASAPRAALLSHFGRYRGTLAVGGIGLGLAVAMQVAVPWSLKRAFDALEGADARGVQVSALMLVAFVVGQAIVRIWSRVTMFNVGRHVEYDLRRDLLDQLHRLGGAFFRRMGTGEIMSRAVNDLGNVRMLFGFASLNLINTAFMYGLALTTMFAISVELTLVALAVVPILILTIRSFGRSMFARSRATQDVLGVLTARVQESLAGIRVVRAYGTEDRELADFDRINAEYLRRNMSLVTLRGFLFPLMGMMSGLGLLVTIWWGGRLVAAGEITIGDLVAMHGYLAMLTWPTAALGYVLSIYQRGRASYDRIHEILTAVPEVPPSEAGAAEGDKAVGPLRVAGLSFSHGGVEVLDGVSFTVPRGGRLAILGRTGSGKTTLANLLPRLLPTPAGSVFIGARDATALPVHVLRRSIGYSPQDPFLFSTTVARNISFGLADPDAPDAMERIRRAARAAQVDDDILSFPEGYDTIVGERGVQLSGGQKQRIALARALVLEPEILILDDPLSAVDAETERKILDAIDALGRDRTLVLVTHRTSAASRTDDVVVLDGGRVVEHGTHAELVARGGIYASFHERQRLEEELESIGHPEAPAAVTEARP